jgi:hypothetical protein
VKTPKHTTNSSTPDNSGRAARRLIVPLSVFAVLLATVGFRLLAQSDDSAAATAKPPADVTFAAEIAPILHAECAGCHRPGGSAPFSLLTYDDAQERAPRIARATAGRVMPPWLPESDGKTFVGERHLTEQQIELFQRWAQDGAPAGDLSAAPEPPAPAPAWRLGEPDLIVDVPTYTLQAEGRDVYRNLVVSIPIDRPRYVTSVELRPGDPRVVHHARMMIDTTDSSNALDLEDAAPGFDGMELRSNASNPEGHFLGWTPGKGALPPLENMAWRIEPGTDLVLQLHMRTTGEEERVESEVGFYFTDTPPTEAPVLLLLSSLMLDIPAGEPEYRVTNSYTLPVAVDLLSIYPHAHYLGKDLSGFATLPGGSSRTLIRIPDWDFNWQDDYRFQEPVRLPAGSVLTLDFTFDNSAENPRNPSDPPVRVVYGSNSMDEMADLILQVLPVNPADRATLIADAAWQNETEDMAYMAAQQFGRGSESLTAGDPDQAIFHFREVMQYQLDHPGALSGLTRAFLMKGDAESAQVVGERAAQVSGGSDPVVLSLLAQAYAALQDGRALSVAERALRLAKGQGRTALADSIQARLPAYRAIPR